MKTSENSKGEADTPLPLSALRLLAPPLRLLSAAMWKVMQQRDALHYGKLVEIITSVSQTVPGVLSYRHHAKLIMGLQALLILEELRQSDPPDTQHVLQELGKLQTSSIPNGKRRDQKVKEAEQNFCTLVHSLLKSSAARKTFFKKDFCLHYGEQYVSVLEKLLWEFLTRLDQLLPIPDLAQTVSWLSAAPAVLEECARSASQPQLLRTLLQHERCLGHLGPASLLSSTGDSILSSLSFPLSGRVQHSIQSESTPRRNRVLSPAPSTPRTTRRTTKEALSQVTPVIGSISNEDLQRNILSNKKAASSLGEDELAPEVSKNVKELSSRSEEENLEKNPAEEYFVGNMLVTVISQTSGSEPEGEEEQDSEEEENNRERSKERESRVSGKTIVKNRNRGKHRNVKRKYTSNTKTRGIESQNTDLNSLLISCMKRQLRVVIPRLNISNIKSPVHLNNLSDEQETTRSQCHINANDISRIGNSESLTRKRKFYDFSSTPEKNLMGSFTKRTPSCSPCIPLVPRVPLATPETQSPIPDSTDDIIVDSEDETETVRRKVFTKHFYKTKNGTYVPTLQEFWKPVS